MTQLRWSIFTASLVFMAALLVAPQPADAQLAGHNILGDVGIQSATQAPPGLYLAGVLQNYRTSTIRNRRGDKLPGDTGINLSFIVPAVSVVTPIKVLGGNLGMLVTFPFSGARLTFPRLDTESGVWGYTDMYVRPVEVGWHTQHLDVLTGYGFYAPTGNFASGADDDTGLGMWSHELLGGATLYFDSEKKWHVSGTGFYEFHGKKKNLQTRVGNIVTVEGGMGRSFLQGLGSAGVAYYGQWKVTDDEFPNVPPLLTGGRNRVNGIGPEFGAPIPLGKKAVLLLRVRYAWEFSARSNTEGQTLSFSITMPLAQLQ